MNNTIPQEQKKLNLIYRLANEIARAREEKLVRYFFTKGYSLSELAKALDITRQALQHRYPDLAKEDKHD